MQSTKSVDNGVDVILYILYTIQYIYEVRNLLYRIEYVYFIISSKHAPYF